jgi:hypothetical protein
MNVMVRQLRAKYPGYTQDIDSMVSSVIGAKPANALRSSLFSEWNEAANAKADNPLGKLEDWAVKDGTLPPDYHQRQQEGNPYNLVELQSYVADKTRIKAETAARHAELSMKISQRTIDSTDMENSYRIDTTQFVQTLLGDASKTIGKNYADVSAKVRQAQMQMAAGMPVNTVELQTLVGQLGSIKMEAEAALNAQFLQSWDGDPANSYANYLDKTTQQDIMTQALAPIDLLMQSLAGTNNPYAVLGSTSAYLEALKSESQRRLLQEVPLLSNIGALTQVAGPDATSLMLQLNSDVTDSLAKSLLDFSTTNAGLGNGSIVDALEKGEASGMKADYYNQLSESWAGLAKMIDSGNVPLEQIQNYVQYMFGQESTAVLSKMDSGSRVMWYTKVASPEISKYMMALRDAGDEQSWNTYQDWVKGSFANIFAQEMNGLESFNQMLSDGGAGAAASGAIYWDKATSSFKAGIEWNRDILGINQAMDAIMPGGSGAITRNLNAAIQVIKPIIADNGDELEAELVMLFEAMGYDGATGIQGAMMDQLLDNVEIGENPNEEAK